MKKIIAIAAVALFCTLPSEAQIFSRLFGKSSTTTTQQSQISEAQKQGQTTGIALKNVYAQYQADGNKFVAQNNAMSLLSLSTSLQGIKSQEKGSGYYKDFAKGLVLGSAGLVKETTQDKVIGGLQTLANQLTSSPDAQTTSSAAAAEAQASLSSVLGNAGDVATSVNSILSLFKK